MVVPLTRLCSPAVPFMWDKLCQNAFKSILCSAPVLGAPNFSRAFKLEVDASASGAGAVLLQDNEYDQLNYSTIEKGDPRYAPCPPAFQGVCWFQLGWLYTLIITL